MNPEQGSPTPAEVQASADEVSQFLQESPAARAIRHRARDIEDSVRKHVDQLCQNNGSEPHFTPAQQVILVSLVARSTRWVDPLQRMPTGFWRGGWETFRSASAFAKLGYIAVVLAAIAGVLALPGQLVSAWSTITSGFAQHQAAPDQEKPQP